MPVTTDSNINKVIAGRNSVFMIISFTILN